MHIYMCTSMFILPERVSANIYETINWSSPNNFESLITVHVYTWTAMKEIFILAFKSIE